DKPSPPPRSESSPYIMLLAHHTSNGRFLHPLFVHLDQAAAACFKQDTGPLRCRTPGGDTFQTGPGISRTKPMAATAQSRHDSIAEHFRRSCETLDRAASDRAMMEAMLRATETMAAALRSGNKILIAGNGGSAADAQHIAGEFLSRLNFDRNPLPAIALTADTSVLTAIGNDYRFEHAFDRPVPR